MKSKCTNGKVLGLIVKDGSLYLPMPEREGYDFAGWYLDDDLTQFAGAYRDTYRITRDTDFYAKWEKSKDNSGNTGDGSGNADNDDNTQDDDNSGETLNTYTIKYDANGGKTKNASVKVVIGGSVKLPGAEREGYTFKGWYTDSQVFIGTEGETYKPSRSISLYARWEEIMAADMAGVTKEQIAKAKEWDLLSYLQAYEPQELRKCGGNEYRTVSHGSLKISNGKWHWHSQGIGGRTALDYLVKVCGMDFVPAVETLCGERNM